MRFCVFVCLYRNIRQTGHGCGAIKLLLDSEASLGVVDIIGEVTSGLDVPMARDILRGNAKTERKCGNTTAADCST